MTATSGLPACSTSSRMARRMSPAKKRALVISLRRALSIASATAGSTISTPIDLARAARRARGRSCRCRSRGRRRARCRAGRRARPRCRRARSAISVFVWKNASGEIRNSRSPSCSRSRLEPASCFVVPPCVLSPSVGGLRPEQALAVDGRLERVRVDRAGRGDEADLQLARARGPRGRRGCAAGRAGRGGPRPAGPCSRAQASTCSRAALERSETSRQSVIGTISSKRPGAWKPHTSVAVRAGAERVLDLVAVAPLLAPRARSGPARSPRACRSGAARRRPARP